MTPGPLVRPHGMQIVPNLWFDGQALPAAEHYCSIFPDSRIVEVTRYGEVGPGEPGTVLTVDYVLSGQRFVNINGGPQFPFTEAVSFSIECADQAELDRYWTLLTADGGQEVQCGWCRDRFGLSWQVVPRGMGELLNDPDPERGQRAMRAMLQMVKIDIDALRRAADGEG